MCRQRFASVLGLKLGGGNVTAEAIAQAIGGRLLLLILDNCEDVIDSVAELAERILGEMLEPVVERQFLVVSVQIAPCARNVTSAIVTTKPIRIFQLTISDKMLRHAAIGKFRNVFGRIFADR